MIRGDSVLRSINPRAAAIEAAGALGAITLVADTTIMPVSRSSSVHSLDKNPGTMAKPLQTFAAAIQVSRKTQHTIADAPIIQLREGVYHLADTVVLGKADSVSHFN